MTDREKLILKRGLIFEGIRGSQAYGTAIEGSDIDKVGVYIQDEEDILGLNYVEQINDENNDNVYYEIRRFLELAMKGNPNILEIFDLPEDCVLFTTPYFDFVKQHKNMFLTKNLYHTFLGYANAQISKAKGLNKKMNWDEVKRKGVLDFCYVIVFGEESHKFNEWSPEKFQECNIGLAKVNNVPDLYSMYYLPGSGGIVGEDSNDVQTRSIPKKSQNLGYLRFDKNAYSSHCKDYREYTDWVNNRNALRYVTNLEHGKGYDSKNMMHCHRLVNMAIDIAEGRGIVVRRPEDECKELIKIRMGEYDYEDVLRFSEEKIKIAEKLFNECNLPEKVDKQKVHYLINNVRRMNHELQAV